MVLVIVEVLDTTISAVCNTRKSDSGGERVLAEMGDSCEARQEEIMRGMTGQIGQLHKASHSSLLWYLPNPQCLISVIVASKKAVITLWDSSSPAM